MCYLCVYQKDGHRPGHWGVKQLPHLGVRTEFPVPAGWYGSSMRRIPIWRVRRSRGPLPGRSRGGSDQSDKSGCDGAAYRFLLGLVRISWNRNFSAVFSESRLALRRRRPTPAKRIVSPLIPPDSESRMLNKLSASWACGSCLYASGEPVQTSDLLTAIDEEIARLERARALLAGSELVWLVPGAPPEHSLDSAPRHRTQERRRSAPPAGLASRPLRRRGGRS